METGHILVPDHRVQGLEKWRLLESMKWTQHHKSRVMIFVIVWRKWSPAPKSFGGLMDSSPPIEPHNSPEASNLTEIQDN